jgi:CBS domain-containing protein
VKLRDFLAAERIVLPLEAPTLHEAGDILLERLASARGVLDAGRLRRRAAESPPEEAVAMGNRAFLLHYRTDAVGQLVLSLGVARTSICRAASDDDGQCARIVIMIAAPPRHAVRYLQVVGAFARLLRRTDFFEGMLAATDAASFVALPGFEETKLPEQLAVRDVMSDQPRTVAPDAPLTEAARTLARTGLGALPVVDDDRRVIGMVTEREVIRHLLKMQAFTGPDARAAAPPTVAAKTVRDAMTRQVLCVAPEQPIAEVASLMSNKDVDRVPVVRDGRLVGFLTRGDIVRKLIGN